MYEFKEEDIGKEFVPNRMMGICTPYSIIEASISSDAKVIWITLFGLSTDDQFVDEDNKHRKIEGVDLLEKYKFNTEHLSKITTLTPTQVAMAVSELSQGFLKINRDKTISLYTPKDPKIIPER
jgi:hypothetical protein